MVSFWALGSSTLWVECPMVLSDHNVGELWQAVFIATICPGTSRTVLPVWGWAYSYHYLGITVTICPGTSRTASPVKIPYLLLIIWRNHLPFNQLMSKWRGTFQYFAKKRFFFKCWKYSLKHKMGIFFETTTLSPPPPPPKITFQYFPQKMGNSIKRKMKWERIVFLKK